MCVCTDRIYIENINLFYRIDDALLLSKANCSFEGVISMVNESSVFVWTNFFGPCLEI